jgi:hypothetical protein
MTDEEYLVGENFDAIIIPGSPYLWHYFHHSHKYRNTFRLKQKHPSTPLIWMGVGSCLDLGSESLMSNVEHHNATRTLMSGDLVLLRDSLASTICNQSGVNNTYIPCPSYYSIEPFTPKKHENLIVWYEPTLGISHGFWRSNPNILAKYYKYYTDFVEKLTEYDIICKESCEIEFATKLGLKEPRVLVNYQDTIETVSHYKNVISGRVHIGVPAMISGAKVQLLTIDSRAKTLTEFQDKVTNEMLDKNFEVYKKLIVDFINKK